MNESLLLDSDVVSFFQIDGLRELLEQHMDDLKANAIITVSLGRIRIRRPGA